MSTYQTQDRSRNLALTFLLLGSVLLSAETLACGNAGEDGDSGNHRGSLRFTFLTSSEDDDASNTTVGLASQLRRAAEEEAQEQRNCVREMLEAFGRFLASMLR